MPSLLQRCLRCDSALCVVFFFLLFTSYDVRGHLWRREARPFFAEERFPATCSLLTSGGHELESLLAGHFYIIRVHSVKTFWAFASILVFLTFNNQVIIFRRGQRPPRRKQFFRSPRLTRWRQGCVWRRRWRSVWKNQSTNCYSLQVLDTSIYNTAILK